MSRITAHIQELTNTNNNNNKQERNKKRSRQITSHTHTHKYLYSYCMWTHAVFVVCLSLHMCMHDGLCVYVCLFVYIFTFTYVLFVVCACVRLALEWQHLIHVVMIGISKIYIIMSMFWIFLQSTHITYIKIPIFISTGIYLILLLLFSNKITHNWNNQNQQYEFFNTHHIIIHFEWNEHILSSCLLILSLIHRWKK